MREGALYASVVHATKERRLLLVLVREALAAGGVKQHGGTACLARSHAHAPARGSRVGETRLERIPFIDVGTRRTRKRKG